MMKNKDNFLKVLGTLMYSWGSEPPPEVHWAGNELIDWVESEFDVSIDNRFEEEAMFEGSNYQNTIDELRSKL